MKDPPLHDWSAKAPEWAKHVPMEGSTPPVEQQQARDDANGQDLAAIQLVEPRATLENTARRRDGSWVIFDRPTTDPQRQRLRVVTKDEVLAACRAQTSLERDRRRVAAKRFTTAIMIRRSAWTTLPAPAARRVRTARPRPRQDHTSRRSNRSNGPPSDSEGDSSGDGDPDPVAVLTADLADFTVRLERRLSALEDLVVADEAWVETMP